MAGASRSKSVGMVFSLVTSAETARKPTVESVHYFLDGSVVSVHTSNDVIVVAVSISIAVKSVG
jgi:hypothetical protein